MGLPASLHPCRAITEGRGLGSDHKLLILDIENPEKFHVDQVYNANGHITGQSTDGTKFTTTLWADFATDGGWTS